MFEHHQEPITEKDIQRIRGSRQVSLLKKFVPNTRSNIPNEGNTLDIFRVSVLEAFVPTNFNEELPLFCLDLGGTIMVLFGQWMFDPFTLKVPEDLVEKWTCDSMFFREFSLRSVTTSGKVLELTVQGTSFLTVQRLPVGLKFRQLRESQILSGNASTLINDLEKAGLIH